MSRYLNQFIVLSLLVAAFVDFLPAKDKKDYSSARTLISRVQDDVKRASDYAVSQGGKNKDKEKKRYFEVQKQLSTLDRHLTQGKFDKGALDKAIGGVKSILDKGVISTQDRDALSQDLNDLHNLRATAG